MIGSAIERGSLIGVYRRTRNYAVSSRPRDQAPRMGCWDSRVPPSPCASARSSTPTASAVRRYSLRPRDGLSTLTSILSGWSAWTGWVSPVSPWCLSLKLAVSCGWRIFLGSD